MRILKLIGIAATATIILALLLWGIVAVGVFIVNIMSVEVAFCALVLFVFFIYFFMVANQLID